jgi:hypothetical protein
MTAPIKPLNSAQRPKGPWICGQRNRVAHKTHRPNNSKRSGHLMCYKTRTSSRATDTREDDLLDTFCYGVAIALGNESGF